MKVDCPHCPKAYNIPDERFPSGKKNISFPCPGCKGTISLDLESLLKNDAPPIEVEEPANIEEPSNKEPDLEKFKKKLLKSMSNLPPMPQVVMKAQEVMADPSSSFKDLGTVIEADPAIAGRVLKLANSAYYGLRGMVSSIHQASVVLGFETLGELIAVVGAAGLLDNVLEGYGLESGFLWQHSLAVAFGSRIIAQKKFPTLENDAFSAGLLHDAGKIILNEHVQAKEKEFDTLLNGGKNTYLIAEKQIFGFDHAEIAFELCKQWHIPESQGLAIKYHHNPSQSNDNQLAFIIHIADLIAMKGGIGTGRDAMLYEFEGNSLEFVGLDDENVEEIMNDVTDSVDKILQEIHGPS